VVWRACGKTSCSRECRDRWAWKHAICLIRSFADRPPTHHVVIRPIGSRPAAEFAKDIGKLMTRLRSGVGELDYARVFEWSQGQIHAHLLLRMAKGSGKLVREILNRVRPDGYQTTCRPIRNVIAMARYLVKHTRNPDRKTELTPSGFRGRMFQASRHFLIAPIRVLWQLIQAERVLHRQVRLDGELLAPAETILPAVPSAVTSTAPGDPNRVVN
jgi:hypothetical protein